MGKILAVDFGLKRTGLAISDESRTFAFGLKTIDSRTLENELSSLVASQAIDTIVLGMPKRLNNEDSHISENVRMLHEFLRQRFPNCKIELMDERFTSKMAVQAIQASGASLKQRSDKEVVDMVSATIILQSFIHRSGNPANF